MSAVDEIALLKGIQEKTIANWIKAQDKAVKNNESIKQVGIPRSVELIVPSVSYTNNEGSLNNDYWAYKVPYGFHDALDIKFEERKKNKIPYMVWSQGCLLSFSGGDFFESIGDTPCLQVASAKSVFWDSVNGVMDDGEVTYELFDKRGLGEFFTVSQFEFLQLLIAG
jgi:hypothetical protein